MKDFIEGLMSFFETSALMLIFVGVMVALIVIQALMLAAIVGV